MRHIDHCLDELEAELDAKLADDECVRALAQLDAREARGEALDAVQPWLLRRHLEQGITRNPYAKAKAGLATLRRALEGVPARQTSAPIAAAAPVPDDARPHAPAAAGAGVLPFAPMKARQHAAGPGNMAEVACLSVSASALASDALLSIGPRDVSHMVAEAPARDWPHMLGMACAMVAGGAAAAAR